MSSCPDADDRLAPLMDEFLERRRNGEFPSLTEFVNRHPELEDEIRDLFPAVAMMEQADVSEPASPITHAPEIERLGDYRIIREIGRGGMGVVYEAVQESLGRHVAIKVLPWQSASDQRYVKRFHREARIAAALHHTNIVPVFGVGEADGVHFLAMQCIRGQSLDSILFELRQMSSERSPGKDGADVSTQKSLSKSHDAMQSQIIAQSLIDKTPGPEEQLPSSELESVNTALESATASTVSSNASDASSKSLFSMTEDTSTGTLLFRRAAELMAHVADALGYAHSQGVLHRDIKPANLMIDVDGGIWVTDFGLAKCRDSSAIASGDNSPVDDNLTNTGDLIGTLRYLAPERFRGESDSRSDVYSLGLTLYEFLTLEPAFPASDRVTLIRQITTGEAPVARKRVPTIPRDLETIVVKATRPDPASRYSSASEMAVDLRRFLEGKPIVARRTPVTERFLLWCRRRPVVAALSGLVLSLLVLLAIGSSIAAVQLNKSLTRALGAEDAERRARTDATTNLFNAYIAQAEAEVSNTTPGRHFASLLAITNAAQLQTQLQLASSKTLQLRNLAVHAMALDDLSVDCRFALPERSEWHENYGFDRDVERIVKAEPDGGLAIYSVANNTLLARIPGKWDLTEMVPATRISSDGNFVAVRGELANGSRVVSVWDLKNEFFVLDKVSAGGEYYSHGIEFSSDGHRFAYIANQHLVVLDLDNGNELLRRDLDYDPEHLCFCPEGDHIAIEWGSAAAIISAERPGPMTLLKHDDWVGDVDWSCDGRFIATACDDGNVYTWDVTSLDRPVSVCRGHNSSVRGVEFNSDGTQLISWGWDASARLWNPLEGYQVVKTIGRPSVFSDDDRFLGFEDAGQSFGRLKVAGDEYCRSITGTVADIDDLSFHPDGSMLAHVTSAGVFVHSWPGRQLLGHWKITNDNSQCRFTPDGTALMVASRSGISRISLDDLLSGNASPTIPRIERDEDWNWYLFFDFGPDADSMMFTNGFRSGIANIESLETERDLSNVNNQSHWFLSVRGDGKYAAFSGKKTSLVTVRDIESFDTVYERTLATEGALTQFSADGKILAISSIGVVEFISTENWQTIFKFANDKTCLGQCAFAPNGTCVAIQSLHKISLLDTSKFEVVAEFVPPYGNSLCSSAPESACGLTFSPDSRQLATGTRGKSLHVWDLPAIQSKLESMNLAWENIPAFDKPVEGANTRPIGASYAHVESVPKSCRFEPVLPAAAQEANKLRELSAALESSPNDIAALAARAKMQQALGQYDKAIADWARLVDLQPDHTATRMSHGYACMCGGHDREALKSFQAVLVMDKLTQVDTATAQNNIAWILLTGPQDLRDPNQALALCRAAINVAPGETYVNNTLGLALYRCDEFEEASQLLEENVANPSNTSQAVDWLCLTMCYHRMNLPDKTEAAWNESIRHVINSPKSEVKDLQRLVREVAGLIENR